MIELVQKNGWRFAETFFDAKRNWNEAVLRWARGSPLPWHWRRRVKWRWGRMSDGAHVGTNIAHDEKHRRDEAKEARSHAARDGKALGKAAADHAAVATAG